MKKLMGMLVCLVGMAEVAQGSCPTGSYYCNICAQCFSNDVKPCPNPCPRAPSPIALPLTLPAQVVYTIKGTNTVVEGKKAWEPTPAFQCPSGERVTQISSSHLPPGYPSQYSWYSCGKAALPSSPSVEALPVPTEVYKGYALPSETIFGCSAGTTLTPADHLPTLPPQSKLQGWWVCAGS